jgi:hypothetical protein
MLDAIKVLRQEANLLIKDAARCVTDMVEGKGVELELTSQGSKALVASGLFIVRYSAKRTKK